MDKAAVGYEYEGKVDKHQSQTGSFYVLKQNIFLRYTVWFKSKYYMSFGLGGFLVSTTPHPIHAISNGCVICPEALYYPKAPFSHMIVLVLFDHPVCKHCSEELQRCRIVITFVFQLLSFHILSCLLIAFSVSGYLVSVLHD